MYDMKQYLVGAFGVFCFWPMLIVSVFSRRRLEIIMDVNRWRECLGLTGRSNTLTFFYLMILFREFRSLYYARIGLLRYLFLWVLPPMPTLYISTKNIGGGLFIQHGFATIVAANSIGENVWINQQVTIGYDSSGRSPVIQSGVTISAGAVIVGGICIGENSVIGANTTITKSVRRNSIVVGGRSRIVRENGIRTNDYL